MGPQLGRPFGCTGGVLDHAWSVAGSLGVVREPGLVATPGEGCQRGPVQGHPAVGR